MTAPRYAHLASKALARAESAPPSAPTAEDRAQTVAAVAREIALRGRRRRLGRGIAVCVAAAGIVAAGLGVSRYLVLDRRKLPSRLRRPCPRRRSSPTPSVADPRSSFQVRRVPWTTIAPSLRGAAS